MTPAQIELSNTPARRRVNRTLCNACAYVRPAIGFKAHRRSTREGRYFTQPATKTLTVQLTLGVREVLAMVKITRVDAHYIPAMSGTGAPAVWVMCANSDQTDLAKYAMRRAGFVNVLGSPFHFVLSPETLAEGFTL